MVLPKGQKKRNEELPIGCASQRRILQLKEIFPEAIFRPVRGNVLTRLRKLDDGEYGALVLAAAGLKRLGLAERISRYFEPEEIIPAAGQGILAMQGRRGEDYSYLNGICEQNGTYAAICERAFVRTLNGGCSSPIAAYAKIEGDDMTLMGLYYDEETGRYEKGSMTGKCAQAEEIGSKLALNLKEKCRKAGEKNV